MSIQTKTVDILIDAVSMLTEMVRLLKGRLEAVERENALLKRRIEQLESPRSVRGGLMC